MEPGQIAKGLKEYPHLHVNVDELSMGIIDAYIKTLYDQIEKEHGIRENFCTYNEDLLEAMALAVATIIYGIEQQSPVQVREFIKDAFIKKFNEYYD